jgi:gliding motility-associated-like protein
MTKPYRVLITDENGCTASDSVMIKIISSCEEDLFVPNLFTPNNDGKNDVLYVRGNGVQAIETFRVFDRWGNLVFETDDMTKGWDGSYKGSMLNDGVFVYYVKGACSDGAAIDKKGNVTLLR